VAGLLPDLAAVDEAGDDNQDMDDSGEGYSENGET